MAKMPTTAPTKTAEAQRLDEAREQGVHGGYGGRTSANASGAPFARTTAPTGMRGIISATIKRAHALITGARTAWPVSVTITSGCVLRWHCGTARTRS
jgi:hypothetical protein